MKSPVSRNEDKHSTFPLGHNFWSVLALLTSLYCSTPPVKWSSTPENCAPPFLVEGESEPHMAPSAGELPTSCCTYACCAHKWPFIRLPAQTLLVNDGPTHLREELTYLPASNQHEQSTLDQSTLVYTPVHQTTDQLPTSSSEPCHQTVSGSHYPGLPACEMSARKRSKPLAHETVLAITPSFDAPQLTEESFCQLGHVVWGSGESDG